MSRRFAVGAALALLVCTAEAARAQPPQGTVTMAADRTDAQVGDTIVLRIRVNALVTGQAHVELPELSDFDVLQHPMMPMTSFGGGPTQMSMTYSVPIRARRPGTFRIPPAALVTATGRLESQPLTITVGGTAPPDPGPGSGTPSPAVDGTVFDPGGFVRTVVDHQEPYVGQQVTVTVYLYAREMLGGGGLTITQEPTADGFWVHDLLPPSRTLDGQPQTVRGIPFTVYVLRRFAAFPLREGELTIGPTGVTMSGGGLFGGIFGGGGRPVSRTGVPVTVRARPLPAEGRPRGDVHVGRLELTAELERTQAATGDAVQLTVVARGDGQLRQVRVPSPSVSGLRVLEPEIDDETSAARDVVGGTRTMRWLLVPEREGTYTLGPFAVPVFDPQSGEYSVARAPALRLAAVGNPTATSEDEQAREAEEDRREQAPSLGPIRSRSALARSRSALLDSPLVQLGFGAGPLLLIGALLVRVARRRSEAGPGRGPKQAKREAKRRLAEASRHASASEPREFYAAIALALKDVLEAKLGRPVGSLTHAELRRLLVARAMPDELAGRVVDELEGCDFARFSAAGVRPEEMERCVGRTKGLLEELDRFSPSPEEES